MNEYIYRQRIVSRNDERDGGSCSFKYDSQEEDGLLCHKFRLHVELLAR
ncbi:hypothetical protein [Ureibacillus manganicus]|nr:hypothetical protein [Ureibacillus manganicus]